MINYDIEQCTWCNGAGIDQSFNGKPNPPNCVRCHGSGKVYVTDELATTKRRRKYMGPVPKYETVISAHKTPVLAAPATDFKDFIEPKKKRGRPPKVKDAASN